jgi:hypothetical protein
MQPCRAAAARDLVSSALPSPCHTQTTLEAFTKGLAVGILGVHLVSERSLSVVFYIASCCPDLLSRRSLFLRRIRLRVEGLQHMSLLFLDLDLVVLMPEGLQHMSLLY